MKLYKVDAVVLSSREMREADRVLVLFSGQRGKLRVAAHGVNKPSSRKRGAVQPFCYSSFLIHRGRELDSVNQCEAIETFPGLRDDLYKISCASYIAELVDAVTAEGQVEREIFALLLVVLHLLAGGDMEPELLARAFSIKLMDIAGFRPSLDECVYCGVQPGTAQVYFSCRLGGVVCDHCAGHAGEGKKYPRGAVEILKILLNWKLEKLDRLKISAGMRKIIKEILQQYISFHTEKRLDSVNFMEQVDSYRW